MARSTYQSTAHEVKEEITDDIINFFNSNKGSEFKKILPYEYQKKDYPYLKTVQIDGVYWRGSHKIPKNENMRDLFGNAHFIISIKEWIKQRNYKQLPEFVNNAGFEFKLESNTGNTVFINKYNYSGTMSNSIGNEFFKGFVVKLNQDQLIKIKKDNVYKIFPKNKKKSKYKIH